MPLTRGTRVGHYEVIALLGAGGMGEVYRARDTTLQREVALKFLGDEFKRETDRLRRFTKEAQATAALNHPNILSVFQIGEHEGVPFIASELLEGRTLRQLMRDGPLPARRAIEYAIQIARGLAAAHDKGIVHRDLKPENIFVVNDGRVKILDFGIAKLTEGTALEDGLTPTRTVGTEQGLVLGTAAYMSPEQVRGEPIDPRSDIFSLGVVLYEILSGTQPFLRKSTAESMSAILKEEPPLPVAGREITPALERVLMHCLEKDPSARFQSAKDLGFNLESLSSPSTQQTKALAASEPGRHGWKFAAMGAAIIGLVTLGVWLSIRHAHPPDLKWDRQTFSSGMISSARFAPDTQSIVYSAAWNGNPFDVYSTHLASPESRMLGLHKSMLSAISSHGELAIVQDVRVVGPNIFTGMLARVPLEGGTPREVVRDVQFADWAPDGSTLALVRRIQGRSVLEYPPGHSIADTSGQIAFPRISPSGDMVAYFDYPDPTEDYGSVNFVKKNGEKGVVSDKWSDLTGLAWSPDGKEIWFTGSRTGEETYLYAVSLDGRERLILKQLQGMQLMDIAPNGRVLLAVLDWRGEMNGAAAGDEHERILTWLDFSVPDAIARDGHTILFHEYGAGGGPNVTSYLRDLDGSPPVKLGETSCTSFSPDGEWVVCSATQQPNPLVLVPTGAGTQRTLPKDSLIHVWTRWHPDGKRLILMASEPHRGIRIYVQDLTGSPARPISPEAMAALQDAISPDGKWVAAHTDLDKIYLFPIDGGESHQVPNAGERDAVAGWSQDSRSLFVARLGELPVPVYRVDVMSGKRELIKTLSPADPSGVNYFGPIHFAPDGKTYVYGYDRRLCDLFAVTGLK